MTTRKRNFYLNDIPLDEAWGRFVAAIAAAEKWGALSGEDVRLDEARGRVTARPVWAALSSPAYHSSAMDGYAVRAADTVGASETAPKRLLLGKEAQAEPVNTGDPIPPWADAVIMIENTQLAREENGREAIEIMAAVAPWTSVRPMGEDMVASELILPANHLLTPVDLGALAGCGHSTVSVRRRPIVTIIPTGSELVTVEAAEANGLEPGQIIEYNSLVLAAQVDECGGEARRHPIVADQREFILEAVRGAIPQSDLILVNAGSSAGSKDFTAQIVEELGTLLVHGVAIRPGHPVILGLVGEQNTPIIGVPGYPVSCALTGEIFVEPLISQWLGRPPRVKPTMQATISRKILSRTGDDEWVRVTVGKVGDRTVAAPLSRGAGVITSLVRADGIAHIPRFSEGLQAGEEITVELYRSPSEIDRTIVHIGSHDLCLDLVAQFLADAGRRFSSANAGSLGGLLAVRRGDAHLAGTHLLDPATGEYNISYLERHLPGLPLVLLTFAHREQGLILSPGNPKGIKELADLARKDVRYVNRQRGAGTRVLLDYHLEQLGISSDSIQGYNREEYTHLAVAAAVKSGAADCGLGIAAAANALELDFIPLDKERYDLVIPRVHYESELLRPLLDLIRGPELRKAVDALPGYDTAHMGEIVFES